MHTVQCMYGKVRVFTSQLDLNQFEKKKGFQLTDTSGCWGMFVQHEDSERTYFLMYINTKADLYTISHECIHLAWYMLDHVQIKISSSNHEALAYLHDYLFKRIHAVLKKEMKV